MTGLTPACSFFFFFPPECLASTGFAFVRASPLSPLAQGIQAPGLKKSHDATVQVFSFASEESGGAAGGGGGGTECWSSSSLGEQEKTG